MNFITQISSYFYPVTIEKRKGNYLPLLEVNLRNGKYLLDGKKVNYSFGSLHMLFVSAFAHHKIQQRDIKNVLILGFGAGSVAHILQKELRLNCKITGVEMDPVVLELANQYFDLKSYQNTQVVCDDAFHFVSHDTNMYDLIVIDLFIERRVPKAFLSSNFIKQVKQRLNPEGFIFYNRINDNAHQEEETKVLIGTMNELLEDELDVFKLDQNGTNNSVLVHHASINQGAKGLYQVEEMACLDSCNEIV